MLLGGGVFASSTLFVTPEISTKYHFVALFTLSGALCILGGKMKSSSPVHIGKSLSLASLFIALVCIRALCSDSFDVRAILPFVCGGLLFFMVYQLPRNTPIVSKNVSIALGCLAAGQALYGFYPLIGHALHGGSFPVIRGSFENPAGYAACLVCLLPWCLFNVRFSVRIRKIFWISVCLLVAAGVILSQSRTGLVAMGCVAILYGKLHYPSLKIWKKRYLLLLLLVLSVGVAGLYFLRPDSANGRLLIWRCSFSLIHDHLLWGSGPNGFQGNYMSAQAHYFQLHPDSGWAMLADNVIHPFNEWLALAANYGIVALLLLGFVVYLAFRAGGRPLFGEQKTALLILTGIAVFCCFSYPFRYAFSWVLAAWALAVLAREEKTLFTIAGRFKTILLSLLAFIALFSLRYELKLLKAEHAWYQVAESVPYRQKYEGDILSEYANIHHTLQHHPQFLFSYGAELYRQERFEESISILQASAKGLNDVDLQLLLAMNYIALEQWNPAESTLRLASRMCPNRFAPLVGLMRVYDASHRTEEAKSMAQTIISKEIKVSSPEVLIFINEAKELLEAP